MAKPQNIIPNYREAVSSTNAGGFILKKSGLSSRKNGNEIAAHIKMCIIFATCICFPAIVFFIFDMPAIIENYLGSNTSNGINIDKLGTIGDFVGGYFGTYITFLSALFLLLTLYFQYKTFRREGIENRYYELLKIHRENVSEIKLRKISGRRVFVKLVDEFRIIHKIVKKLHKNVHARPREVFVIEVFVISYYCLYYGVGENSSRMLENALKSYSDTYDDNFIKKLIESLGKRHFLHRVTLEYKPFDGHQSRFGHYFRHLYQSVRFIHDQDMGFEEKRNYIKTIRAQLSNHEQALFFINSLSPLGAAWKEKTSADSEKKGLIEEYELIKNLPTKFFDPKDEIDIKKIYTKIQFEDDENDKISSFKR